ncbi:MAG: hypothetical protein GXP24_00970 [Planctomycetes bacterium]|nr:hypothetical protein [Planctomycetota bacterium]
MLLPRYSLRTTLIATSGCAVFFVVLGQAVHGQPWAIVVSVAVVSLVVMLLVHALLYLITAAFSRFVGTEQLPAHTSRGGVQTTLEQPSTPKPDDSLS